MGLVTLWCVASSWARDQTVSLALQGKFLTIGLPGKLLRSLLKNEQILSYILLLYQFLALYPEKAVAPTPVLLPEKSHGRRSLVGCSPRGRKESDTTERLYLAFEKQLNFG